MVAHWKIYGLNKVLNELINSCIFENIIFLSRKERGQIEMLYKLDKNQKKYVF